MVVTFARLSLLLLLASEETMPAAGARGLKLRKKAKSAKNKKSKGNKSERAGKTSSMSTGTHAGHIGGRSSARSTPSASGPKVAGALVSTPSPFHQAKGTVKVSVAPDTNLLTISTLWIPTIQIAFVLRYSQLLRQHLSQHQSRSRQPSRRTMNA